MTPAVWPRDAPEAGRLLRVDPRQGTFADLRVADLPVCLRAGDLVVVNDAATLPASLDARTPQGQVEVRLAAPGASSREWTAVLFGGGTWRNRTEDRPAPPRLGVGDGLAFGGGLGAEVSAVGSVSPRLVGLRFDREGSALWAALYAVGRPVQYSYLCHDLALGQVQTPFASRPWSVEMPSAGRPLRVALLRELRRHGVEIARLTHAAGLSATGDALLDAALPLPERYDLPASTVAAIAAARARGGRVVAAGTTVVRALEGSAAANGGALRPGEGTTDLRIGEGHVPVVVDGLLSGLHEPGASHFELLTAFAPRPLLLEAVRHAEQAGYLAHEFGDSCLVLPA